MTDFQKMIRDIPDSLRREETIQKMRDEPDLVEYVVASYLAQHIVIEMHDMFKVVAELFKEQTGLEAGTLKVTQVIGTVMMLEHALTKNFVEESPAPHLTKIHLLAEHLNYLTMVEELRQHLKKMRPE